MFILSENEFTIGSVVSCTICHQQKIQGEVMAFDYGTKMLTIKSHAASGKCNVYDVKLINLSYVSEMKVIREADRNPTPPPLLNLNAQKIHNRVRSNIEERHQQMHYMGVGVSPKGQKVFNVLVKTIQDVKWDGASIIVLDEVTIKPPYDLEDCHGKEGSKMLNHVIKIIQTHHADRDHQSSNSIKDLQKSHSLYPTLST